MSGRSFGVGALVLASALVPLAARAEPVDPSSSSPTATPSPGDGPLDTDGDMPVPRVTRPPAPRTPSEVPPAADPAAPADDGITETGDDAEDDDAADAARAAALDDRALLESSLQAAETIEITDTWRGKAQAMRESAEAVQVIETEKAARESADLGEVLARSQGVGVRRSGGLGSAARFSLAGLTDDQVRFFLDGLPLELAGFTLGIANVPVNLVERVEIYRGVVPIRFGADALGGAVNLATDQTWYGTQASASYQAGSFGIHRTTAAARHRTSSGLIVGANGFFDRAVNDYPIDVEVADDRGKVSPATVTRHNDSYRAYGGQLEAGVVDQPWARRLTVRGFASRYDKEIPHNAVMTVPYGEARYGGTSIGATARWDQMDLAGTGIDVETALGYDWRTVDFVDKSAWVYDWYGERIRERSIAGEIEAQPTDQITWNHDVMGRVNLSRALGSHHQVRATAAPTFTRRRGTSYILSPGAPRDPQAAQRDLFTSVAGIEHEVDGWSDRFENIAFVKDYVQVSATEEVLAGGAVRDLDRTTHRFGIGDSARWRFRPWLWGKASYEWATRLPRPDEVFGDSILVSASLGLEPETSHNANLGLAVDASSASVGTVRGELTLFGRLADDLIVLLGNDRRFSYQNVYAARSLGVDAVVGWTVPGEWLSLDASATYIDLRNASSEGTFGDFEGDRIPHRPWLQGATGVTLQHKRLFRRGDLVTGTFNSRYVHEYFRSWESQGRRDLKQVVPSQLVHGLSLTYLVEGDLDLSFSAELSNLTDSRAFDFFGVQRPGRALSFKATVAY